MKNSETSKLSSEDYHQLNQQRNTNHRERKGSENEGKSKKIREGQNEREREWMEDLYSISIISTEGYTRAHRSIYIHQESN